MRKKTTGKNIQNKNKFFRNIRSTLQYIGKLATGEVFRAATEFAFREVPNVRENANFPTWLLDDWPNGSTVAMKNLKNSLTYRSFAFASVSGSDR